MLKNTYSLIPFVLQNGLSMCAVIIINLVWYVASILNHHIYTLTYLAETCPFFTDSNEQNEKKKIKLSTFCKVNKLNSLVKTPLSTQRKPNWSWNKITKFISKSCYVLMRMFILLGQKRQENNLIKCKYKGKMIIHLVISGN